LAAQQARLLLSQQVLWVLPQPASPRQRAQWVSALLHCLGQASQRPQALALRSAPVLLASAQASHLLHSQPRWLVVVPLSLPWITSLVTLNARFA